MQQPNPVMENTGNFVMPNYNQQSSQKIYLEDEQEFRDALIKEIKSQKKAINKLIKTNDQLIVTVQTLKDKMFELAELLQVKLTPEPIPTEEIIDEVDNKS
jgi:translation initiation factor 6 (eIF-6)